MNIVLVNFKMKMHNIFRKISNIENKYIKKQYKLTRNHYCKWNDLLFRKTII